MNYVRRLLIAIIILAFLYASWYGAEMLIHGESQRSIVDLLVAILISISFSGKIEKGVEENERKHQFAEKFATEFIEHIKKREEAKDGENGKREQSDCTA